MEKNTTNRNTNYRLCILDVLNDRPDQEKKRVGNGKLIFAIFSITTNNIALQNGRSEGGERTKQRQHKHEKHKNTEDVGLHTN